MSPKKSLTIFVMTVDCIGHLNACMGTCRPLLERGHRVIFLLDSKSRGTLLKEGFEEFIVENEETENDSPITSTESGQSYTEDLLSLGIMGPGAAQGGLSLEERYVKVVELFTTGPLALAARRRTDPIAKRAIAALKPDLLLIDGHLTPAAYFSGLPWVNVVSVTALCHLSNEAEELPPSSSGMASNSPRNEAWHRFKKLNLLYRYSAAVNDFHEEMGYLRFPDDRLLPFEDALITVYAHPKEYNWPAIQARTDWFNLEVFNKGNYSNLQQSSISSLKRLLPKTFISDDLGGKWSGKWILLSMGSMGGTNIALMRRLMASISGSVHKFIVSKGPRAEEFSLPANAWGERYLPQTALLPLVDLVITHAGKYE